MTRSCIISDIKRYIDGKWRFFIPHLHSTPPLGVPDGILSQRLMWKTRMVWRPDSKKVWGWLALSTQYRRVTDGRTHGQRGGHLATLRYAQLRAVKLLLTFPRLSMFVAFNDFGSSHSMVVWFKFISNISRSPEINALLFPDVRLMTSLKLINFRFRFLVT